MAAAEHFVFTVQLDVVNSCEMKFDESLIPERSSARCRGAAVGTKRFRVLILEVRRIDGGAEVTPFSPSVCQKSMRTPSTCLKRHTFSPHNTRDRTRISHTGQPSVSVTRPDTNDGAPAWPSEMFPHVGIITS